MWHDLVYAGAAAPLVIAVVVAVVVWKSAGKERSRRALHEGLSSTDPAVRHATLEAVDEETLAHHAALFCDLLAVEQDPTVLDALASAVARSRWEPTDDGKIVELRRWVAGRHALEAAEGVPDAPPPARDVDADLEPAAAVPAGQRGDPASEEADRAAGTTLVATPASMIEPMGATDLSELVPKMRALLGTGLSRMEFVSIDGEVMATWSSTDEQGAAVPASAIEDAVAEPRDPIASEPPASEPDEQPDVAYPRW